jgi:hypothetical protein
MGDIRSRILDIVKRLCAFERKCLRRMCGIIEVNENLRKLYNKKLLQLFRD